MTSNLSKSHKQKNTLVEFSFGDPIQKVRYTDSNSDLSTIKGFFLAKPGMEVKLPSNTIGLDEKGCEITLPIEPGDTFAEEISRGRIFPPVTITIFEIFRREPPETDQILTPFRSRLTSTEKNPENRVGAVRFRCLNPKSRLTSACGIQCNPQCENTFGDSNCSFDVSTVEETGTATLLGGSQVRITGLTSVDPLERPNYFIEGWVSFNGLNLSIFQWDAFGDQEVFTLERLPPPSWDGEDVVVTPGCLKTIGACREWDNEMNFRGLGIAIPTYNPVFEFQEEA